MLDCPPTFNFPPIPAPPVTINAPAFVPPESVPLSTVTTPAV